MPIPKPRAGETQEQFVGRCMADPTMRDEYDQEQRAAVCFNTWNEASKSEDTDVVESGTLASILRKNAVADGMGEDPEVTEAFITDDGGVMSVNEVVREVMKFSMRGFDPERIHDEVNNAGLIDIAKNVEGSTQSIMELGGGHGTGVMSLSACKVVKPPYPPELLSAFLESDETHFRCCKVKVTDAVLRSFSLEPTEAKDGAPYKPGEADEALKEQAAEDVKAIRTFMHDCNEVIGLDGVLERAGMDWEAVGWAAMEVVRSPDMIARKLAHVPAVRVRAVRGWKGYVEIVGPEKYVYYQPLARRW